MATKTNFEDPALGGGIFVGDLKYGRCNGNQLSKAHDYPANRTQDGKAQNLPAVSLKLVPKRDPSVWCGKAKVPKVDTNFTDLRDQLLLKLNSQSRGLIHHLRVIKFGKQTTILE